MEPKRPEGVVLERGEGELRRLAIDTPLATAHIYLHGAHITHWQPAGQKPVLWLSRRSRFSPSLPIRGGVPICFPWFGPRAGDGAAPMHGFARLRDWELESARRDQDGTVTAMLRLSGDAATRACFPTAFVLRYRVTIGLRLGMELVLSALDAPADIEQALHSYFNIGDVRRLRVTGLAGALYLDKTEGMKRKMQGPEPIALAGETDRVYLDTISPCVLEDPVLGRRIRIEKAGSRTTVLWNPGAAKAKAMADFGDDEWMRMVCLETANTADNRIAARPGQTYTMSTTVSVEAM